MKYKEGDMFVDNHDERYTIVIDKINSNNYYQIKRYRKGVFQYYYNENNDNYFEEYYTQLPSGNPRPHHRAPARRTTPRAN